MTLRLALPGCHAWCRDLRIILVKGSVCSSRKILQASQDTPEVRLSVKLDFPVQSQVCTPIDPDEAWGFDPETVPTVQQLLREARKVGSKRSDSSVPKWEQTSLASCMHFFKARFLQPLQQAAQKQFNDKARQSAAKPTLAW